MTSSSIISRSGALFSHIFCIVASISSPTNISSGFLFGSACFQALSSVGSVFHLLCHLLACAAPGWPSWTLSRLWYFVPASLTISFIIIYYFAQGDLANYSPLVFVIFCQLFSRNAFSVFYSHLVASRFFVLVRCFFFCIFYVYSSSSLKFLFYPARYFSVWDSTMVPDSSSLFSSLLIFQALSLPNPSACFSAVSAAYYSMIFHSVVVPTVSVHFSLSTVLIWPLTDL